MHCRQLFVSIANSAKERCHTFKMESIGFHTRKDGTRRLFYRSYSWSWSTSVRTENGIRCKRSTYFNWCQWKYSIILFSIFNSSIHFILRLQTKIGHTGPLVDVSVLTFHWRTSFKPTPAFTDLLARVPKWAYYAPSVKSLQTHVY